MQRTAEEIFEICETALREAQQANPGAAIQAQAKLSAVSADTRMLGKDSAKRLTSLRESAGGYLTTLASHGAHSAMQGGLDALRRRAEAV